MSQKNEQIVHDAIHDVLACNINAPAGPASLPVHVMELAHALLPRLAGSTPACCTLADLMVACYQLGMSRAIASVSAGLEVQE